MKRIVAILPVLFLGSVLVPRNSSSVPNPTSLTLRSGYVALENLSGDTHPATLSFSCTWDLGKQTAFWSSVGYIQETGSSAPFHVRPAAWLYDGSPTSPVRTHLVPISAGFRAYANDAQHRSRGLFVEAGPSLYGATYRGTDDAYHLAALGGFQCGMGVRFAVMGGSRLELGGTYRLAEAIGKYPRAVGRLATSQGVDYHLFDVYLALGFGD